MLVELHEGLALLAIIHAFVCIYFSYKCVTNIVLNLKPQTSNNAMSELLKRTDPRTHVRAKFSRICAIFLLLNAKLAKQPLFHIFGAIWQSFSNCIYIFF